MSRLDGPQPSLHAPTCPYCRVLARLAVGPHGRYWKCPEAGCDARVGCHRDSPRAVPLGRMARGPLRVLRMKVHAALDPMWKVGNAAFTRSEAYAWLAGEMGLSDQACHIAQFDESQCEQALAVLDRNGRRPASMCPCRGCGRPIEADYLVCEFHWRKITPATRHRIGEVWNARCTPETQPHPDYITLALIAISEANGGGL